MQITRVYDAASVVTPNDIPIGGAFRQEWDDTYIWIKVSADRFLALGPEPGVVEYLGDPHEIVAIQIEEIRYSIPD